MKKWNFRKQKKWILKTCSSPNWADDDELPISKNILNIAIKTAHKIQKYFYDNGIELDKPHLGQCGDGSIDLNWDSYAQGYTVLYNFHPVHPSGDSLYGDNECRNWKNTKEIEITIFNNPLNMKILKLFEKWCEKNETEWRIDIKKR